VRCEAGSPVLGRGGAVGLGAVGLGLGGLGGRGREQVRERSVLGQDPAGPAGSVLTLDVAESQGPGVGDLGEFVADDRHVGVDRAGVVRVLPDEDRPVVPSEHVLHHLLAGGRRLEGLDSLAEDDDQEAHAPLLTVALEDVDVRDDVAGRQEVLEDGVDADRLGGVREDLLVRVVRVELDAELARIPLVLAGRVGAVAQTQVVTRATLVLVTGLDLVFAGRGASHQTQPGIGEPIHPGLVDPELEHRSLEREDEGLIGGRGVVP